MNTIFCRILACFLVCCFVNASVLTAMPFRALAAEITVYTAAEPELLPLYSKAFQAKNPDITIKWIRDSAGPILARLVAENGARKADAIFALSLTAVLSLQHLGMFSQYSLPDGAITPTMRNPEKTWVASNAWGASLCVNTSELEKRKLPLPQSWKDLTRPEYAGQIVMPSPVSSGTALLSINGWLQSQPEEAAWGYMESLHKNIKMYVHSGCKPCQMAAQGEVPIGIASDTCARVLIERGAPITLVTPSEGVGWDMEVAALVDKHPASKKSDGEAISAPQGSSEMAASRILDFAASEPVAQIAVQHAYIPARTDAQTEQTRLRQKSFLPIDFKKAAASRDAIIAEWRKRFEQK